MTDSTTKGRADHYGPRRAALIRASERGEVKPEEISANFIFQLGLVE
jgi:hypothetical protein